MQNSRRLAFEVLISICFLLGFGKHAIAATEKGTITVEPIIGYERVQKLVPTPHTSDRLTYGIRATAGILLLSAEGEYTHANDSESFPSQSLTTTDTADRIKLGARSTFALGSIISLYARAGVQASQLKHEQTASGVYSTSMSPVTYNPYAGAGVIGHIGRNFYLSGTITAIFTRFPDMSGNEYDATLGFSVHFP